MSKTEAVDVWYEETGLWTLDLGVGLFWRLVTDDDIHSARRRQATNNLYALNFRQLSSGGVPNLDPERARWAMNPEARSVIHNGQGFCGCSIAQLFEKFGNERFEFVELNQHRAVSDFGRRQFNWLVGFEQQTRLCLVIAFLLYRHLSNQSTLRQPGTNSI